MNDSFFIKAAAYGGYDKAEVDKQLEFLYKNIKDLKNRLRETEFLLKKYEGGDDAVKAHEGALAAERAALTQTQLKNKTLSEKYKAAREETDKYKAENEMLRDKLEKIETELSDARLKISGDNTDIAEILSSTFLEAQKSGTMILENAKEKAKLIETEAKKFADEFISDVNLRAKQIIDDAEKQADDIIQNTLSENEQLRTSSQNLHAIMLEDVKIISENINKIRADMTAFEKSGMSQIETSSVLLSAVRDKLAEGGIPVVDAPVKNTEYSEEEKIVRENDAEKQNLELARLQALAENLETDDFDLPEENTPPE